MSNIQAAIVELHKAFRLLNKAFFQNELPEPAITIQSSGKRMAMGWCSSAEVWTDREEKIRKYELNISAEYLNVDFFEMMDTMLHEMVHLHNAVKGVKDTSRNGTYHNKRFKTECERRGFYFPDQEPDKQYGWSFPKLTEEAEKKIQQLGINQDVFVIARKSFFGAGRELEKKSNSYKWVCPSCQLIVRSSKPGIHVKCGECDKTMENKDE